MPQCSQLTAERSSVLFFDDHISLSSQNKVANIQLCTSAGALTGSRPGSTRHRPVSSCERKLHPLGHLFGKLGVSVMASEVLAGETAEFFVAVLYRNTGESPLSLGLPGTEVHCRGSPHASSQCSTAATVASSPLGQAWVFGVRSVAALQQSGPVRRIFRR